MTSETKQLISIEEFDNVGPVNTAFAQTYKPKTCIVCSKGATNTVV